MGSLRGRLTFAAITLIGTPGSALAQTCHEIRPQWDGAPVTMLQEAIFLFGSPLSLILLLGSALAVRFRHQWGALVAVLGWTAFVSVIDFMPQATGLNAAAQAEGCLGSSSLFIAGVAAICVSVILYTAPPLGRD